MVYQNVNKNKNSPDLLARGVPYYIKSAMLVYTI